MQKTLLTGPATRLVLEGTSERMPVSASAYVPAILPLLAAVLRSPNFVILVAVTNRGRIRGCPIREMRWVTSLLEILKTRLTDRLSLRCEPGKSSSPTASAADPEAGERNANGQTVLRTS